MEQYVVQLDSDHPGFSDVAYRGRRDEIARMAPPIESDEPARAVEYTDTERATWAIVFDKLTVLYPTHACSAFNNTIGELGFTRDAIPQLPDVSAFLSDRTGFRLQPVAGLVSAREFLGKLAQRAGIRVGVLSARSSAALERRVDELDLDEIMIGRERKGAAFDERLGCKLVVVMLHQNLSGMFGVAIEVPSSAAQ